MHQDPAIHWARSIEDGTLARWEQRTKSKMRLWNLTITSLRGVRRGIDIAGSICALLAFSPIFAITAFLIKLEDRGPIFFKQTRVGLGGRPFGMWKFRSMVVNADKLKDQLLSTNEHGAGGVTFKMKHDPRITRVGRWIRKLSVDEFPQFFNVLCGEMSLVGPRPPVPREVSEYKAFHLRRLRVKPGITCLWQIGGRSDIDFEGQVRLDLQYIRSSTPWLDLVILVKTVPAVLFGKGAY